MKINCKINIPEAVRRDFNVADSTEVEIDVSSLSFKERDVLSSHLMGQNFKHPVTHLWPSIPEPTAKGLQETLAQMVAGHQERKFVCSEIADGVLDVFGAKSEHGIAPGKFVVTENEPNSTFPSGNYCAWRIEKVAADGTAHTVLDLAMSDRVSRELSGAVRTLLRRAPAS